MGHHASIACRAHSGSQCKIISIRVEIHAVLWLFPWRVPFNSTYVLVNTRHRIESQPAKRPKILFVFNVHPLAKVTQVVSISKGYGLNSQQEFPKMHGLHT